MAHLLFFYICCWCYPPADVFSIKVFNCQHKNWLTYSDGTDRFGELCYSFSISNKLSQTIIWHSCWLRWSLWSITVRDNPWDNIFKLDALMLFPNFVSASRLELICISLIVNTFQASFINMGLSWFCYCSSSWCFSFCSSEQLLCV